MRCDGGQGLYLDELVLLIWINREPAFSLIIWNWKNKKTGKMGKVGW